MVDIPQIQHIQDPMQQDHAAPIPDQIQHPQIIQPRIRCTHKDEFILSLLSKLQLCEKFIKNKEIEDQNKAREMKTYNHHLDPVSHPVPGLEMASFITINEADLTDLKDPSVLNRFLAVIPDFLLFCITRENRAEKEKRKVDESNAIPENSQEGKRRCMDGNRAAEHVIGTQRAIEFSDILFTTNVYVPIPLPFFCNKNLCYLIDHVAMLPTTKSNPLLGQTKGQFILNIANLAKGSRENKGFGEELSLDFGEWSEAAKNCFVSIRCRIKIETMVNMCVGGPLTSNFFMRRMTKLANMRHGKILSSN
jgi:hypothetical protein